MNYKTIHNNLEEIISDLTFVDRLDKDIKRKAIDLAVKNTNSLFDMIGDYTIVSTTKPFFDYRWNINTDRIKMESYLILDNPSVAGKFLTTTPLAELVSLANQKLSEYDASFSIDVARSIDSTQRPNLVICEILTNKDKLEKFVEIYNERKSSN